MDHIKKTIMPTGVKMILYTLKIHPYGPYAGVPPPPHPRRGSEIRTSDWDATVLFKTILTTKRLKNIMQEIYPGNLSFSLTPYLAWPGVLPCTRVCLFARKRLVS